MSVIEVPANNEVGLVRSVSYSTYPGALVVARGGMLMAQGNATCPIQFSFLGDPMDGSVGLDVQGQWGGVVLCGAGALNTFIWKALKVRPKQVVWALEKTARRALWTAQVKTVTFTEATPIQMALLGFCVTCPSATAAPTWVGTNSSMATRPICCSWRVADQAQRLSMSSSWGRQTTGSTFWVAPWRFVM